MKTTAEYNQAKASRADRWVPACGGNEQPFLANGTNWLYCYNFGTGQHGYLNLDTDMIDPSPSFLK